MPITYTLVNPQIKGSIKTEIKADNSLKAAKKFYGSLSEHFNNTIPSFYFTIQKGKSGKGKYYHFKATEEKSGNEVDITLEPYQVRNENENMERFTSRCDRFNKQCEMVGGGKAPIDDDIFATEEEEKHRTLISILPTMYDYPIGYFWYDPYIYNLDLFFIPTFYPYLTPIIEIGGI